MLDYVARYKFLCMYVCIALLLLISCFFLILFYRYFTTLYYGE